MPLIVECDQKNCKVYRLKLVHGFDIYLSLGFFAHATSRTTNSLKSNLPNELFPEDHVIFWMFSSHSKAHHINTYPLSIKMCPYCVFFPVFIKQLWWAYRKNRLWVFTLWGNNQVHLNYGILGKKVFTQRGDFNGCEFRINSNPVT